MINYNSIDAILSSTNLIEVPNVDFDEGVFEVVGAQWFKFKGVSCEKVYFSANSWFGLGATSSHLLVNNRDARSKQFFYEEGTLYTSINFVRYKWVGQQHYSSTASGYKLIYDVVLFETGDIFLNVTAPAINESFTYTGTNSLICTRTIAYKLSGTTNRQVSFYHLDELGNDFEMKYEMINIPVPYQTKWLVAKSNNGVIENVYSEVNGVLVDLGVVELTSQLFIDNGSDTPISDTLTKGIQNCTVLFWDDAPEESKPSFIINAKQLPTKQILYTGNYSFDHQSIFGIEGMQIQSTDDILFQISFDNGVSWSIHNGAEWVNTANSLEGQWMSKVQFETISQEQWSEKFDNKMFKVSMVISGNESFISYVRMKYLQDLGS